MLKNPSEAQHRRLMTVSSPINDRRVQEYFSHVLDNNGNLLWVSEICHHQILCFLAKMNEILILNQNPPNVMRNVERKLSNVRKRRKLSCLSGRSSSSACTSHPRMRVATCMAHVISLSSHLLLSHVSFVLAPVVP